MKQNLLKDYKGFIIKYRNRYFDFVSRNSRIVDIQLIYCTGQRYRRSNYQIFIPPPLLYHLIPILLPLPYLPSEQNLLHLGPKVLCNENPIKSVSRTI